MATEQRPELLLGYRESGMTGAISGPLFEAEFDDVQRTVDVRAFRKRWPGGETLHQYDEAFGLAESPVREVESVFASAGIVVPVPPGTYVPKNDIIPIGSWGNERPHYRVTVGYAEARVYPSDGVASLWSVHLNPGFMDHEREYEDPNLEGFYVHMEIFLQRLYAGRIRTVVTTAGGPQKQQKEAFLRELGYTDQRSIRDFATYFTKEAPAPRTIPSMEGNPHGRS